MHIVSSLRNFLLGFLQKERKKEEEEESAMPQRHAKTGN
jgi:hypothetical protein